MPGRESPRPEDEADDVLRNIRTGVLTVDADGRLLYANAHLNYLFRSFPPRETLIGKSYEELIRLEIEGGEIAPGALAGGAKAFVSQRVRQLKDDEYAARFAAMAVLC